MKYYMHTINGRPAGFAGDQICFAQKGNGWKAPLVKNLNEIKRQQKLSKKWRNNKGLSYESMEYDYVIIESLSQEDKE